MATIRRFRAGAPCRAIAIGVAPLLAFSITAQMPCERATAPIARLQVALPQPLPPDCCEGRMPSPSPSAQQRHRLRQHLAGRIGKAGERLQPLADEASRGGVPLCRFGRPFEVHARAPASKPGSSPANSALRILPEELHRNPGTKNT